MFRKRFVVVGSVALLAALACLATLQAQERHQDAVQGKEMTLRGKIVDLQCYMSGQFPSADKARCTRECIRAGVPAALETPDGLVMIGKGHRGPAQAIAPHAFLEVDMRGRLYEKNNLRYIDLLSVTPVSTSEEDVQPDDDEGWTEDEQQEDQDWDS
ncbi:MAG: hypothetical protein JSU68_02030 [Phycisphaerales bacterium]|nr:MAG: hypothetical protein JSU68_02030 [Phycisphaerales bacterium]